MKLTPVSLLTVGSAPPKDGRIIRPKEKGVVLGAAEIGANDAPVLYKYPDKEMYMMPCIVWEESPWVGWLPLTFQEASSLCEIHLKHPLTTHDFTVHRKKDTFILSPMETYRWASCNSTEAIALNIRIQQMIKEDPKS